MQSRSRSQATAIGYRQNTAVGKPAAGAREVEIYRVDHAILWIINIEEIPGPVLAMPSSTFLQDMKNRRTVYQLTDHIPISDEELENIIHTVTTTSPTAFDHQGTHLVVLVKDQHKLLWKIVRDILKAQMGSRYEHPHTQVRLHNFEAAYGTVLFFEETGSKKEYASRFKQYADHFTQWGEHGNAMAQFALWTALASEGCGCNLQHYNPLIDGPVKQQWGIDQEWQLKAQLVFGGLGPEWQQGLAVKKPSEGRYRIYS